MKNSPLPWRLEGNLIKCAAGYNVGSVNSHKTTEGQANAELIVNAVNGHAALIQAVGLIDEMLDANVRLLEAQRQGDQTAIGNAQIDLYAKLETLTALRDGGKPTATISPAS